MKCEEIGDLISGYVDLELTQQEAQRVRLHLESCDSCSQTCAEIRSLQAKMGSFSYPATDHEMLENMEKNLLIRSGLWSGWAMIVLGVVVMGGFGVYRFLVDPAVPGLVKFFFGLLHAGFFILFLVVLRQRLLVYKNDKYTKVKL